MRRRLQPADERGAVVIMLAVSLPVLVGFSIFVVDVANWWVHKRHLQTQADAAALAGATRFSFPGCSNALIEGTAIDFSGGRDPDNPGVEPDLNKNPQLGTTPVEEVHTEINEATPYGRTAADYTDPDFAGKTDAENSPCTRLMVDVKMTETDLPWFLRNTGIVEWIDAQARVELQGLKSLSGLLPLGVEEVNPKRVRVEVWDEDANESLGATELCRRMILDADGNPVPLSEDGLLIYDDKVDNLCPNPDPAGPDLPGQPLTIEMNEETINGHIAPKRRLGLRVIVSGTSSVTCGQPQVLCYGSGTNGLTRIRGYLPPPSPLTSIELGEVALLKDASCALHDNGYFSTACDTETIQVDVPGLDTSSATVKATIEWKNSTKTVNLTWDPAILGGRWVGPVPVDAVGAGSRRIDIEWSQETGSVAGQQCGTGGGSNPPPCEGTYANVHKVFSGSRPVSGPIKDLRVDVGANTNVNNVQRCAATDSCPQTLTFRIGIAGRNELADLGEQPISLRFFGEPNADSQSQALDCDPTTSSGSSGWTEEVVVGCTPTYTRNAGTACPPTTPALWASPQPYDCTATQTGNFKLAEAFNERILCRPPNSASNCPDPNGFGNPIACTNPNNWPDWLPGDVRWTNWGGIDSGDPRIVPLFLVPFGTFNNTGTYNVPVIDFAWFYVTGWTAQGGDASPNANPCKNAGDAFEPGTENDDAAVSGHFMSYTGPVEGGVGEGKCELDSISGCLAVMTK